LEHELGQMETLRHTLRGLGVHCAGIWGCGDGGDHIGHSFDYGGALGRLEVSPRGVWVFRVWADGTKRDEPTLTESFQGVHDVRRFARHVADQVIKAGERSRE
jgi:hypothetical protein